MSILFECHCGVNLRTKDELASQPGECPNCARHLTIPVPQEWQPQLPQAEAAGDSLSTTDPTATANAVSPLGRKRRSSNLGKVVTITSALFILGSILFWTYFQFFAERGSAGEPADLTIQWYTADSLPKLDPQAPKVQVSADDRKQGITFVVVETDVPLTLMDEPSGDLEYRIDLSDCELKLPDGSTAARGGLRVSAGFAAASRIVVTTKVDEKSKTVSFGVFFPVTRDLIDKGGMTFRYRNATPIELTKENSR